MDRGHDDLEVKGTYAAYVVAFNAQWSVRTKRGRLYAMATHLPQTLQRAVRISRQSSACSVLSSERTDFSN